MSPPIAFLCHATEDKALARAGSSRFAMDWPSKTCCRCCAAPPFSVRHRLRQGYQGADRRLHDISRKPPLGPKPTCRTASPEPGYRRLPRPSFALPWRSLTRAACR